MYVLYILYGGMGQTHSTFTPETGERVQCETDGNIFKGTDFYVRQSVKKLHPHYKK